MRREQALGLLGLVLAGCGPSMGPRSPADRGALLETHGVPRVSPGRLFPVLSGSAVGASAPEPDGSVPSIEHGLRIARSPDGRIQRASEIFPEPSAIAVLPLPSRLGSGFLFRSTFDGTTSLYRSERFAGPLRPLVRLPFEAADVVAGFDRLLAVSSRTRAAVSLDAGTGELLPGAALPAAAGYGGLAFADGWVGAVDTDVRGVLVTFDAGQTFHPLGSSAATPSVSQQNGRIVIATPRGFEELLPSGELRPADAPAMDLQTSLPDGEKVEDVTEATAPSRPPGGVPLELAVRSGVSDSAGTAVYAHDGRLVRVSLGDGRVLEEAPHEGYDGGACRGVRLGKGIGFVCVSPRGGTSIFALATPLAVRRVARFDGERAIFAGGTGALSIRGGCGGGTASPVAYCITGRSKGPVEVHVKHPGIERVVALGDGRAVSLLPPHGETPGALTVFDATGRATRRTLSLRGLPEETAALVRDGLWLDGMTEIEQSTLGGWVFGGTAFVGVRVALDGTVSAGHAHPEPENAMVAGSFAFHQSEGGLALESVDGGLSWSEVDLPLASDTDEPDLPRGCTDVGCSLGSFIRVGWGGTGKDLTPAPRPADARLDTSSYVSFRLQCSLTNESEMLRVRIPPSTGGHPGRERAESGLESSAFRPFLGLPAPRRGEGDLGFDFGTEDHVVQTRGYVWGPRGAAWDRTGSWVIRGVDRFAVENALWTTAVSRPPWIDESQAAEVFGSEPTHRVINEWGAVLDPGGQGGVILMRTGTRTDLAVVEKDRAIVFIENAGDAGIERLSSAVKVLGKWYVGAPSTGRTQRLFVVDGGRLSQIAALPRIVDDSPGKLVRNTRGDELGVWVVAHGQLGTRAGGDTWLVYPLDPRDGTAEPPLSLPPSRVARAPAPCAFDREGWLLPEDVSPSLSRIEVTNVSDPPGIGHVEARLIADPQGICLSALAARVDGSAPKQWSRRAEASRAVRTVPMALTDRATDRRWGFRCAP